MKKQSTKLILIALTIMLSIVGCSLNANSIVTSASSNSDTADLSNRRLHQSKLDDRIF